MQVSWNSDGMCADIPERRKNRHHTEFVRGGNGTAPIFQRPRCRAVRPATDNKQRIAIDGDAGGKLGRKRTRAAGTAPRSVDSVEQQNGRLAGVRVRCCDVDELRREASAATGGRKLPRNLIRVTDRQQLVLGAADQPSAFHRLGQQLVVADDVDEVPAWDEVEADAGEQRRKVSQPSRLVAENPTFQRFVNVLLILHFQIIVLQKPSQLRFGKVEKFLLLADRLVYKDVSLLKLYQGN